MVIDQFFEYQTSLDQVKKQEHLSYRRVLHNEYSWKIGEPHYVSLPEINIDAMHADLFIRFKGLIMPLIFGSSSTFLLNFLPAHEKPTIVPSLKYLGNVHTDLGCALKWISDNNVLSFANHLLGLNVHYAIASRAFTRPPKVFNTQSRLDEFDASSIEDRLILSKELASDIHTLLVMLSEKYK